MAIGEGRQGADAGALLGGIEGGARVGIVAHGPRVDGQLRMGTVIVLEACAVFRIGLEGDDPPAPPEEESKRTPMMRSDINHDGTRRRFGEGFGCKSHLVDVSMATAREPAFLLDGIRGAVLRSLDDGQERLDVGRHHG